MGICGVRYPAEPLFPTKSSFSGGVPPVNLSGEFRRLLSVLSPCRLGVCWDPLELCKLGAGSERNFGAGSEQVKWGVRRGVAGARLLELFVAPTKHAVVEVVT